MMQPDLAALVGSRICHDLISPIGAISNGVELLSLTDGDTGAEMELISQSVENASARIRYFRIAFGATSDGQMISQSDVVSILAATAQGGRFGYFWQVEGDQPRLLVRCAFLMLQCLQTALPMGGDVYITRKNDQWHLTAEGKRLSIDAALWDSLHNPASGFTHSAAQVQFALLPGIIASAGRSLSVDIGESQISARF